MNISAETPEQTDARLKRVMAEAEVTFLPGEYAFVEQPVAAFPSELWNEALAFVRDDDVWSALCPAKPMATERIALFRFHFSEERDNSGFVGWLATALKRRLGTGTLVICGQNSGKGGVFDYWGVPAELREQVWIEVMRLREVGYSG